MKKNKKEKFQEIRLEIPKDELKKAIKAQKNFCTYSENILSCVHIELKDNIFEMCSTDGNRLLVTRIEINNAENRTESFNVKCSLLEKLVLFNSSLIEWIEVIIKENSISFNDYQFGIKQEFDINRDKYPEYSKLIPDYQENEYSIGLNRQFFKDLSSLQPNKRTNIIELKMDKTSNIRPIIVRTGTPNFRQIALLMPVQIRG